MGRFHELRQLWSHQRFFLVVFILGCVAHLSVVLFVDRWLSTGLGPALLQNSDEVVYYEVGQKIATALRAGASTSETFAGIKDAHRGYYYLVGGLVYLGADPLHARLVNAAIGMFAPILFLFVVREAGVGLTGQKIAFALFMFWPSSVLWTSLILKEALGYSLTALVLLATSRLIMRQAISYVDAGTFAVGILALSFFRSYAALMLLAILTSLGALMMREQRRMILLGGSVFLIVAIVNPGVFELFLRAQGYRDEYRTEDGYLTLVQTSSAKGGSAISVETPFPFKLWLFVTFPLPWQASTLLQKLAVPEVLLWLLLLPSFLYGLWLQIDERNLVALLMIAVFLVFSGLYLYIVNNLGTLFRIKSSLSIYYLYFVAVGLEAFWVKFRSGYALKRW